MKYFNNKITKITTKKEDRAVLKMIKEILTL